MPAIQAIAVARTSRSASRSWSGGPLTRRQPAAVSSPARSRSPEEKERLVTSTTGGSVVDDTSRNVVLYVQDVKAYARAMHAAIDRSSPLPFYYQLKQILLADLRARDLAPGTRLPGDHELCGSYDVSRTVVRQALAELETEGVIERVKGRGTFVAQRRTAERLVQSLTGLFEDVAARGGHLRSDVRRQEVVPADGQIADQLQLSPGHRSW